MNVSILNRKIIFTLEVQVYLQSFKKTKPLDEVRQLNHSFNSLDLRIRVFYDYLKSSISTLT